MKKMLIAIVGVLIAGYLASPVIIGLIAKARFPALVAANSVGNKTWKADDFHLGYLHSSAESSLTIPVRNGAPVIVHMHHRIFQRLAPDMSVMEVTSTPTFEGKMGRMVALLYGDKPPLVVHTLIYLDGHYRATFDSPPVPSTLLPGGSAVRVRFDGMHGTETGTFHPLAAKSRLTAPGLEIESATKGIDVKLSGMALQADLRHPERWMQLGSMQFTADDINLTQVAAPGPIDLSGLSIKFDSRRENRALGAEYDIRLSDFHSPQAGFKHLVVEMGVHHIDEKSVKALAVRFAAIGRMTKDRQQAAAMYLRAFRSLAPALLAHSPEFRLKRLAFDLASGRVQLQADAKFNGAGFVSPLTRKSLRRLAVDADATLPKATLQQALKLSSLGKAAAYVKANKPNLDPLQAAVMTRELAGKIAVKTMQTLLQRGLLRETGDDVSSHLTARNGQLTINGQPMGSPLVHQGR